MMIRSIIMVILLSSVMYGAQESTKVIDDPTKSKIEIENIKNDQSKENMQKWLDNVFGLQPYRANYILPFAIANKTYRTHLVSATAYSNKEAEIQVSLKLKAAEDLFGLGEKYYVSYTHHAFWQIYIDSAPFRENLYNPEGFVVFPISDTKSMFHMRSLKVAVAHKSNGQPNTTNIAEFQGFNLSKSINYFYTTLRLQHGTLISDWTFLLPFPGSSNLSDNPDLMKYLGYTEATFTYFYNKNMFSLMVRGNLDSLKGALELSYSHPIRKDKSYLYAKLFSGYVESLVDYNQYITKFAIGFSFSR